MKEPLSILTQSRFFSPAFNGAIFDGPVRLYFSQTQEAAAMKLYFAILSHLKSKHADFRDSPAGEQNNIFILMYPTAESFRVVFPSDDGARVQMDRLDSDYIVALNGPLDESEFPSVLAILDTAINQSNWHQAFVGF
jgi:hypothetical protein